MNRISKATEQQLLFYRWERIQLCKKARADFECQYRRELIHRAAREKDLHLSSTNPNNLYDPDAVPTPQRG